MKTFLTIFTTCFIFININAQVGIGTTNPNAQLDISATNQSTPLNTDGILIPKIDEFPSTNPTAAQDSMLVFVTGNGTPTRGFYYWDQGSTSWVLLNGGVLSEWTDSGTYITPTDGFNEDVTIGGTNNNNARLTVRSDKQISGLFTNTAQRNGFTLGVNTYLNNTHTTSGSYSVGNYNDIINDGLGYGIGVWNYVRGTGSNSMYGNFSRLEGSGAASQFGTRNDINGIGDGQQSGTYNYISNSGDGTHYGSYSTVFGTGTGLHYGSYQVLSGTGTGIQYGSYNLMTNSGNSNHYGTYNTLLGGGSGGHFGTYNQINGSGTANRTGTYTAFFGTGTGNMTGVETSFVSDAANLRKGLRNNIQGNGSNTWYGIDNLFNGSNSAPIYGMLNTINSIGSGIRYGVYNNLQGAGTGNKYGIYNLIPNSAGGNHFGIYSNVLKTGSYAGYFLGNVAIGTNTSNIYTLPSSRGSNGQVMQTDGAGNVSWTSPITSDTSPAWYDEGTTNNATSTSSDIIRSGNIGVGVSNANHSLHIFDNRGTASLYIEMDDTSGPTNTISYGIRTVIDNDNNGLSTGDSFAIENTLNVLSDNGFGTRNNITGHLGGVSTIYGTYNLMSNDGSGDAYGTYNNVGGITGTNYGSYNSVSGIGYGVYSSALTSGAYAGYFLGTVSIGTHGGNIYSFPSSRGTSNQVMISNGAGILSWIDGDSLGVQKIDDLTDGKSDNDGSDNGSSLFIGESAGGQDDSSNNRNVGIGYYASYSNQTGEQNVAIGSEARHLSVAGNGNVAIGAYAGYNNFGNDNVAIGRSSGPSGYDNSSDNISIGALAGSGMGVMGPNIPTGNILIGKGANPYSLSGSNQLNIGNFLYGNTINGSSVGGYFSGNLGVGYYNPTSTLHVGGDIRMDYPTNGNYWRRYIDGVNDYNFEYNGTLLSYIQDTDGSYNIFSDRKLKNNIKPISKNIMDKVPLLDPVTYVYKKDKTQTNQFGFIAQDVQKLFPELVHEKNTKNENYLSLNYQAFSVLAIKTIQEQQKEIEKLKEEISILKKLEQRIEKLEMN